MNLDLFHCLSVILYVCSSSNLANVATTAVSTTGAKALLPDDTTTITDGYDLNLASPAHSHHVKKDNVEVTMRVKSKSPLHRHTYVHKI